MGKILNILFFLFGIVSTGYSQSPAGVSGCDIWLKNDIKSSQAVTTKSKQKNDLNFNSAVTFSDSLQSKIEQTMFKNRFTVFVVYKSNREEHSLFAFKNKKDKIDFTTKKIVGSDKIEYNKGDTEKGIIIGYLTSMEKKGKNSLKFMIESLKNDKTDNEKKTSVLEFIYFSRFLNPLEMQKIEAYLSVKYGVSLSGEKDYITSQRDTIWNFKSNKEFNQRVTGIGRDDLSALYQKQSGNSVKDGLYIGVGDSIGVLNSENKGQVTNGVFLLWGDNGKASLLKQNKREPDDMFKMERIWKMESRIFLDSLSTSIYLNKDEMTLLEKKGDTILEKSLPYWLVVDNSNGSDFDYFNADYIKEFKSDTKSVSFKNIGWKGTNSKKFTFVKAPNFFFDCEIKTVCEVAKKGSIKLNIRGGMAPYSVEIYKSDKYLKSITTSSKTLDIDDIDQGNYKIILVDNKKVKFEKAVIITSFEAIQCQLVQQWYLNGMPSVTIQPIIISKKPLAYSWMLNGSLVSEEKEFKATQTGNYALIVKNDEGCEKEIPFTVDDKTKNEGWVLYPNPTKRGEKFSIAFNFNQPTAISIKITDLNGRTLKTSNLGEINEALYTETLNISGTYIVLVTKGNTTETIKLIIE